jgi:NAD(P)-dependent dehydrogenase (short-subunit alcohol dehydrogenase family)
MTNITLVTGASQPGRNTALSIARHGGDVIITYRNGKEAADAVVAEIQSLGRKAIALQLDMSNMFSFPDFVAAVRAALKDTWGRDTFDHLINNAGHGEMTDFVNTTEAQFDALFDVHVKGVFFLTQSLLPILADGGRIINFSSGLTRVSFLGSRPTRLPKAQWKCSPFIWLKSWAVAVLRSIPLLQALSKRISWEALYVTFPITTKPLQG